MPKFTDKWGKDQAAARYGTQSKMTPAPKDECYPESPADAQGPDYNNDSSGWVRGMGKDPHFKPGP